MAGLVGMTPDAIQAVQARFKGEADNLEAMIGQITNLVQRLNGPGWSDQGYIAFESVMHTWNQDVMIIKNDLNAINIAISNAVQALLEADAAGVRGLGGR